MKNVTKKTILTVAALLAFQTPASASIFWDAPAIGVGAASAYETQSHGFSQRGFEGGMVLGSADVRRLQKSLASDGFYTGKIDGIWGGQTTQAILDYQSVNRKPLTGKLSAADLREFGIYKN